jgi:hypothetical protein
MATLMAHMRRDLQEIEQILLPTLPVGETAEDRCKQALVLVQALLSLLTRRHHAELSGATQNHLASLRSSDLQP